MNHKEFYDKVVAMRKAQKTTSSFVVQRICRLPNGWNAR